MTSERFEIGKKHRGRSRTQDENTGTSSERASWNTPRKDARSGISYGTRMALSFAVASVITVLILVGVVSVVWSGVFSDYTRANMEDIASATAQRLATSYETDGEWTSETLESVADSMVSDDIGIQVTDASGEVVYDDTWPTNATEVRGHSLTSTAPTEDSASVTESIVTSDGETVGSVRIWVLGSDVLLSKADNAFRDRTFNAMILAAVIAVCISIIIGFLVSRMLTKPIRLITSTAKQVRDGDLSARTGMRGDDEIDRLGETFDEMATSLERDLQHERRITSDVAHELRTPLQGMLATVEAMQDGVMPADEEHLETVASETRRLARLVQQMLDLSRMEAKSTPLNIEEVDVVSLVRQIVSSQEQLFREHDLRLRFNDETQRRNATIEADPDLITQAVINIMSNAMRYTPEGGWVVVSVKTERRGVQIIVSDTGIGIAKEDLPRIFSRFWRADASRAREAGGLGVGLSLTQQIVERHNGYISVDSELEKGTTFTIHLPREHTPESPSTKMET